MLSLATYSTPNGLPEVIHVAALRCIGWSVADVARALAAMTAAAKAEEARRAKIEAARPLWAKPSSEISSIEITQRVGMSLRSLHKWLGPRRKPQSSVPG